MRGLKDAAVGLMRRVWRAEFVSAVTPLGWGVAGLGAVCAVIGWLWGWLEFRTLAFLALALVVVAVLLTLRRAIHDVTLELHQPRVQVGEPGLGRVWIRGQRRGSSSATIELPVGRAVARFRVAALGADDSHEELFSIPTRRRGVVPVGPVRAVQADPVGLIRRTQELTPSQELFIHPRVVMVEATAIGFLKDVEGITTANLSSSDVSFHALRDYVPGDDRRSVHWKTTARTGRLMVRQFEETMRAHLLLMLSTVRRDYATGDDFEAALSAAASLSVAALREERQVSFYTSAGRLAFPTGVGLLDELCRVELTDDGPSLQELALLAGSEASGVSVAGFITGGTDPMELRAAQLVLPQQIKTFALRNQSGLTIARHQVGDITVLDLPELEQLPRALGSLT